MSNVLIDFVVGAGLAGTFSALGAYWMPLAIEQRVPLSTMRTVAFAMWVPGGSVFMGYVFSVGLQGRLVSLLTDAGLNLGLATAIQAFAGFGLAACAYVAAGFVPAVKKARADWALAYSPKASSQSPRLEK